jgi:hypothetical protein
MPAVRIICPGCGAALASAQAFTPGKLTDCPRCRLLFIPTTDDISNPRSRADDIAAERAWAEDDVARPYPSPSPYGWRRNYRWLTQSEFGLVLVACVVMLVLASIVIGIYTLTITGVGPRLAPPVTTTTSPPVPAASEPASAPLPPVVDIEVQDDPLPRKPVPKIDDDVPPVTPSPPPAPAPP